MDSDKISEELFDEYIEFDDRKENSDTSDDDDDVQSDKENTHHKVKVKKAKQPKTNHKQFNLMDAFAKDGYEQKTAKEWDNLTDELNKCGPPIRDSGEWRRVWSLYKSNGSIGYNQVLPLTVSPPADQVSVFDSQPSMSTQVLEKQPDFGCFGRFETDTKQDSGKYSAVKE